MNKIDKELLLKLKENLEVLTKLADMWKEKSAKFDKENETLLDNMAKLKKEVDTQKAELRLQAEEEYKETLNKKLLGGLGVRVHNVLVYDIKEAEEWALKHDMCMALDVASFEAIAKTLEIDFVKKEDKLTITFPKEITINND